MLLTTINGRQFEAVSARLRQYLADLTELAVDVFISLGGVKTVRLRICDPGAMQLIRRELTWSMTTPVEHPDATITLWRETAVSDFTQRVLGIPTQGHMDDSELMLMRKDRPDHGIPFAQINTDSKSILFSDGNEFFWGTDHLDVSDWIREGHLFAQLFYRILNTPHASLVHGACIGLNSNGILFCARGQCGKSTLTVTAMLQGFEYVSDDYLILEDAPEGLLASPIYSIITLSPRMYNALYDAMDCARFVGVGSWKGKYIFDMTAYQDRLRYRYPVKVCMFPEIDPEAPEPRVTACTPQEKGRAITHLVHSTVAQNMYSMGLQQQQRNSEAILKLVRMLQQKDFYKITLTQDIFRNEECLRQFALSL